MALADFKFYPYSVVVFAADAEKERDAAVAAFEKKYGPVPEEGIAYVQGYPIFIIPREFGNAPEPVEYTYLLRRSSDVVKQCAHFEVEGFPDLVARMHEEVTKITRSMN